MSYCGKGYELNKTQVIIFSRPGCHLCDEAKQAIQSAGCSDRFTLAEVNIESDDELLKKYKYDIPVVTIDGVEAFRHRVDAHEFKIRVVRG
ncbi:MAG TPA: glutaredoxin family protein [Pyrinomonadaceae bacterium]|nr:glutaredoxin family protein [Pyrinomonadaceae bacterium]